MKWLMLAALAAVIGLGVMYQDEIEASLSDGSPKVTIPGVQGMSKLKGVISKSMRSVGDTLGP